MKVLTIILYIFGFTFEATIPVVVLCATVPFTKTSAGTAITFFGVVAALWFIFQIYKRLKKRVIEWERGFKRALVLAVFKLVPLVLITIFVKWIPAVITAASTYWFRVLPIMIVGIIFTVFAEVCEREVKGC